MTIRKFLIVNLLLILFIVSCSSGGEDETTPSSSSSNFSSMSFNLSYAGWGTLDLNKSLYDGFAVYGCRSVTLKDVKVASVNYEGEPDLEFFGAVGGMGEIEITGNSYVSGDLVYPPGGTYTVSNETEIKGFKYAWGVSECPWWSYENASKWDLKSNYPEVLTVSSKVTLEAGGYRFKLLDVESGGELYGEGVSIVVERLVVNGGKIDIGKGLMIAEYADIDSGFIRGRLFADTVQGENVEVQGKVVGNDVSISRGKVFYNGDVLCKDDTCRILYAIEVSEGIIKKKFEEITTNSISIFTKVLYSSQEHRVNWCSYGVVGSEDGLAYLLNLAKVMKKLGYCLSEVYTDNPNEGNAYTAWITSVSNKPINIFYLQRILNNFGMVGRKSSKLLPFRLVGVKLKPFDYNYFDIVTSYTSDYYLKRLESMNVELKKSSSLSKEWESYSRWVTSNCFLPDYPPLSSRFTPLIGGEFEVDKGDSSIFSGQIRRVLEKAGYTVTPYKTDGEDNVKISALGGIWSGLGEMNYFSPTLLDYFHVLYSVLPLLDPEECKGEIYLGLGYPFLCIDSSVLDLMLEGF